MNVVSRPLQPDGVNIKSVPVEAAAESWTRRYPIGAEPAAGSGTHFRVWTPPTTRVEVVIGCDDRLEPGKALERDADGYFSGWVAGCKPGDLYRFRLDGADQLLPDPASRYQPEGPLGPSMIIDPSQFNWRDAQWPGVRLDGQVIYELHIGTFTREGSWQAAVRELPELKKLGVTMLEIMPVNDFCGVFGWGYDGVNFFAPTRLYGVPDDFRAFVDEAHCCGLAVILDVVYNHAGPTGNFLKEFSKDYFTDRYDTDWGEAVNFDGPDSAHVRQFFRTNAGYWIAEFHLDGLRLDATQALFDASEKHILRELVETVRQAAAPRLAVVIGENEPQNSKLLRSFADNGYGIDGLWNDDFHHAAMAALTGRNEAYYSDYRGTPQEFISGAKHGYLFQGQYYSWQKKPRGDSTAGLPPPAFINYLQNHDQIANEGRGWRVHRLSDPALYRVMTALFLLSPQTPMLFQGQEFAASTPFAYFADHQGELADKVKKGRLEFLRQFPNLATEEMQSQLPDPTDSKVFASCKLDLSERQRHHETYALHGDLLRLRREDPAFNSPRAGAVDGAVLKDHAFVLRFSAPDGAQRLLLVNLGADILLSPIPEPLLAPPDGMIWRVVWFSEHPRYGGGGAVPVESETGWFVSGKSAYVLAGAPR
ncbi:MAG: malto-oligosyltrehalose trehalohydrolase [Deltaproteobacteria bacterium]|nr:malto-oligosyltrehalose trehalohydrolase [Deltaproteobacteria bacterium]